MNAINVIILKSCVNPTKIQKFAVPNKIGASSYNYLSKYKNLKHYYVFF